MKIGNALDAEPGDPRCEECPLSRYPGRGWKEKNCVQGDIVPYAPIAFIGIAPGKDEVRNGRVFVGPAGRILDLGLESVGIEREREASILNLLACKIPDSPGKPNDWSLAGQKAVKACAPRFVRDLLKASPQIVVTLGKEPLHALNPAAGTEKISKLRGYFREIEGFSWKLLPTWHPAYLLYDMSQGVISQFNRDLRTAREVSRYGQEKPVRRREDRGGSPLPGLPERREGVRPLPEEAVDWSVGSLLEPLRAQVLDIESDVMENDPSAPRLLCAGVAPYPRSRPGRKVDRRERPQVRVVPVGELPHRLEGLRRICGHNTPYDYAALRRQGLLRESDPVELDCTMTMGALLDENREAGLKTYAEEHDFPRYWEEVEKYWKRGENPPPEVLHRYNAHDVGLTSILLQEFSERLAENPKLERYYQTFIRPCLRLAAELHLNGMKTEESLTLEAPRMRRRIWYQAHRLFDIAGTPRENRNLDLLRKREWLQDFLFSEQGLKLPIDRRFRTKVKKEPQLTRDHFEHLSEEDESGATGILYDLSFKQKEYTDLKKMLPFAGGMIYPTYNVGGTGERDEESRPVRTGRWSARDPNVQQFAPYLRRHIGSRYPRGWILQWDGDQIEARVATVYSRDPNLVHTFVERLDPYIDCASLLFGRDKAEARRFMGKRSLLAAIYGVGAKKLRKELNKDLADRKFKERVTDGDCEDFLAKLRDRHRVHQEWIGDTRQTVRRTGRVESLTGRVRHLPLGRAADRHALNQAINFPIQSLANDCNLLSALLVGWRFSGGVLATLVHDSGVLDCSALSVVGHMAGRIHRVWKSLPTEESFGFKSPVPLTVTLSAGRRWSPLRKFQRMEDLTNA